MTDDKSPSPELDDDLDFGRTVLQFFIVPASVVAWLATQPGAEKWNGQTVFAQKLCLELQLQPDWRDEKSR